VVPPDCHSEQVSFEKGEATNKRNGKIVIEELTS